MLNNHRLKITECNDMCESVDHDSWLLITGLRLGMFNNTCLLNDMKLSHCHYLRLVVLSQQPLTALLQMKCFNELSNT